MMAIQTDKPETNQKPKRINRERAAELADLSLSTIKRAINRGTLKSFKVEGARFILYEDFVKWLGYDPYEPN